MTVTFHRDVDYNYASLTKKLTELRADYDPHQHLAVTTCFKTIQGEMPFAGIPAVFLRLAGCNRGEKLNRGCYFCDTYFAVTDHTQMLTVDAAVELLQQVSKGMTYPMLVITGGEPMLQASALIPLLDKLLDEDLFSFIQFETNGDLFKTTKVMSFLDWVAEANDSYEDNDEDGPIHFVVSPKRSVRDVANLPCLRYAEDPNFHMRLLISGDENSVYYHLPTALDKWPIGRLYLSPITEFTKAPTEHEIVSVESDVDITATRRNVMHAIAIAQRIGCRVSLQAHSYIGFA